MSLRWSNQISYSENEDVQIKAMALDYEGSILLLAGRRYLSIKRFEDASDIVSKVIRNEKYESTVAEWNYNNGHRHLFAITNNEKVVCSGVREGGLEPMTNLKHHTRQATDLNWHPGDPYQLATASADASALVWDRRDSRRPIHSFTAVAGVSQVKWNKVNGYLLATSHDGDLRIWDVRKGMLPVQYITSHSNQIHCIDWSGTHEFQLASASEDGTIKILDMNHPKSSEAIIPTGAPAWRVRYTPWGEGLLTAVVPLSGSDSSLQLWNASSLSGPVHSFVGPLDMVVEVLWRREGNEYQLITLSRDQCLRVWRIEPFLQRLCGFVDTDVSLIEAESEGLVATALEEADIAIDPSSPMSAVGTYYSDTGWGDKGYRSLEEELTVLKTSTLPGVVCEKVDLGNRCCFVTVKVKDESISIVVFFPPSYPFNAAPSFEIEEPSILDPVLKAKLLKMLKQTAQQKVDKNRTCLESCLSQLVATLEGSSQDEEVLPLRSALGASPARVADAASVYSSFHDAYIPYPRFCGARFCSVGHLVYYSKPVRIGGRHDSSTPRSLSATTVLSFGGGYPRYRVSVDSENSEGSELGFSVTDRPLSRSLSRNRTGKFPRMVTIYNASKLFFVHKQLAEKYVMDRNDIVGSCTKNAAAAATVGRMDLVQVWTLAALSAASESEDGVPWSHHPFSTTQMHYLIQHYAKIADIQTAAMLSCVVNLVTEKDPSNQPKALTKEALRAKGTSPYHTITVSDHRFRGWAPIVRPPRSLSWSDQSAYYIASDVKPESMDKRAILREELKHRYADLVHMWGLLETRTAMQKTQLSPPAPHWGLEILLDCQNCGKPVVASAICSSCLRLALRCAICRVLVRGASNVCLSCGHGGHASHIKSWFTNETLCPTGCGCYCLTQTRQSIDC